MHPIETPDKTFHDGDGVSELGTILPAWWLNQVQSELLAVLTAAGIQPDKSQPNQLLAALNRLAVVITGDQTVNGQKTFTAQTQFQSGIHLSANQTNWNGGHKAYIGADADNAHIVFGDDTLRLHGANNRISYNNHDIFHKANKPRFAEDIQGKPNTLSGYGIGNFKVETFRGDLNTLKTDGIYSLPTAVGSSNLPVENTACHIQVIAGTKHGWCRQLGYPAYTSDVYERHQTSSANDNWSAWKKLNSDGIPVGAIVSFPKAVQNPAGYLKANGTTFAQNTFPDLYRALGNSNRLPDLSRTDIGITAWFPSDQIPTGWLAFDDIRTRVTETAYPELYRLLTGKYGSIQNVPQAEDRFIRNAGNSLAVGTKQEDEIKRHVHKVFSHWTNHTDAAALGYEDRNERQRSALVSTWTDENLNDNGFLTPRSDSKMATGGDENRPKALVLKLCIKAADTLGEAVFWIKSHGETINAGALDAGTLAQGLQDKADRRPHPHRRPNPRAGRKNQHRRCRAIHTPNHRRRGYCQIPRRHNDTDRQLQVHTKRRPHRKRSRLPRRLCRRQRQMLRIRTPFGTRYRRSKATQLAVYPRKKPRRRHYHQLVRRQLRLDGHRQSRLGKRRQLPDRPRNT